MVEDKSSVPEPDGEAPDAASGDDRERALLGLLAEIFDDPDAGALIASKDLATTQSQLPQDKTDAEQKSSGLPTVPGYEVLERLGRGGMGVVYKARHSALKRLVALKLIRGEGDADDKRKARLQVEAEAVARLTHANIVQVYEAGEYAGGPFIALEYIDGSSLSEKVKQTAFEAFDAAELTATLAEAVQVAHAAGIIHRDLKPGNVLITADGVPKIADFGLAKQLDSDAALTISRQLVGTPSYMAPEQASADHGRIGPPADVYALGAILYELLTGAPPFRANTVLDTLEQIREREPVPPSAVKPRLSRDLETICLKCLQKEPEKRYASAQALADDLRRFLGGKPIHARPVGQVERLWRWSKRNPGVAVLTALVASLLLTVAAGGILLANREHVMRSQAETAAAVEAELKNRANAEAQRAQTAAALQLEQTARANAEARRARRHLYLVHMNSVQRAWEDDQIATVSELLDRYMPRPGEEDMRGFEWYYWHRLANAALLSLNGDVFAFSPNGKYLAVTNTKNQWQRDDVDTSVRLVDLSSKKEVHVLKGHGKGVNCIAFSADGKRLASGSDDRTIKLWDVATGKDLQTVIGHTQSVCMVAFSADGTRLISASKNSDRAGRDSDQTVIVWDLLKSRSVFSAKTNFVLSPDGKLLAGTAPARVWDTASGRERLTLNTGSATPSAFSPDGKLLAGTAEITPAQEWQVKVWDTANRREPLIFPWDGSVPVAFSPDGNRLALANTEPISGEGEIYSHNLCFSEGGRRLASPCPRVKVVYIANRQETTMATAGDGRTVNVWDVATGQHLFSLSGHTAKVHAIAQSPDGKRLASASRDKKVKVWDPGSGKELVTLKGHTGEVDRVSFSPDGTFIASASTSQREIKVWRADSLPESLTLEVPMTPRNMTGQQRHESGFAFSPSAKFVATASGDVEFSPSGRLLVAESDLVTLWDLERGRRTLKGSDVGFTRVREISPGDHSLRVWDMASGRHTATLRGHSDRISALAFSRDGRRLASVSLDHTMKMWDVASATLIFSVNEPGMIMNHIAFSADGKLVGAVMVDTVRVWNAETGQKLLTLNEPGDGITFSPDGRLLAVGAGDGVIIRSAVTGERAMRCNGQGVYAVTFNTDGTRLAAASGDGAVIVWDVATGEEILTFKQERSWGGIEFTKDAIWWFGKRADELGSGDPQWPLLLAVWDARPWTTEREIEREKLRAAQEARLVVTSLLAQSALRPEVFDDIKKNPSLSPEVRRRALEIAEQHLHDPSLLNAAAWRGVAWGGDVTVICGLLLGQAETVAFGYAMVGVSNIRYELPLWQAKTACRLAPDDGEYWNTLGILQYGAGKYQEALATLERADKLNSRSKRGRQPADLAFLAMSHFKLGQKEKAQTELAELRQLMKQPRWSAPRHGSNWEQSFFEKAEQLVGKHQ
jgi:WD40 repeat protein/predicted Ser/Thr protein kinase